MTKLLLLVIFGAAAVAQGQQPVTPRTPWHVSRIFVSNEDYLPGVPGTVGTPIATVPNGYNAVIEHISARCVIPATLVLVFGEITVPGNPSNPGQSGRPGPQGQDDTANHPVLFQTAYSGGLNVY